MVDDLLCTEHFSVSRLSPGSAARLSFDLLLSFLTLVFTLRWPFRFFWLQPKKKKEGEVYLEPGPSVNPYCSFAITERNWGCKSLHYIDCLLGFRDIMGFIWFHLHQCKLEEAALKQQRRQLRYTGSEITRPLALPTAVTLSPLLYPLLSCWVRMEKDLLHKNSFSHSCMHTQQNLV